MPAAAINPELFTSELLTILEETFVQVHGMYLDKNTSLLETLRPLSAAQASVRTAPNVFPVCAHAAHVLDYLRLLERILNGEEDAAIDDWATTWQTLSVSDAQWKQLQADLHGIYERLATLFRTTDDWNADDRIANAFAIVAHTAYHIGAMRQIAATG